MKKFYLFLVKPTRYDDDGYPVRWGKSLIPSNSLACLYALADECRRNFVLGEDVDIQVTAYDECNSFFDLDEAIALTKQDYSDGLLLLVGVQTNQFPRAMDLAKRFVAGGGKVCIGGFHVSGILSMLKSPDDSLQEALNLGVSLFAGEAEEGRLSKVIQDASMNSMKNIYNYLAELPALDGASTPFLPYEITHKTYGQYASFDLGRGCPFICSFCSIINVQGRTSRFRSVVDLEKIVRDNVAAGIKQFFITDDNLARNRNWEKYFDFLISLREKEGIKLRLIAQVDTMVHLVPGFIDKAVQAGVDQIFIGLESVNEKSLKEANKKQNKINEFRTMLLAWKRYPVVITAGYIIGFPSDTPESVARDVEVLKKELPLDIVYFSYLTPLPGSQDHRDLFLSGSYIDNDLNRYDLAHRVTHHPVMTDQEWESTYVKAYRSFYTYDHMVTVLRRMVALKSNKKLTTIQLLIIHRQFPHHFNLSPLESGIGRCYQIDERRPGLPRERFILFFVKTRIKKLFFSISVMFLYARLRLSLHRILTNPKRFEWRDNAIK